MVGRLVEDVTGDLGGFCAELIADSQLRWLGPEKGVIHLAIGTLVNAAWDLAAKLDVKAMLKDAVARGSINPSHFLIDVEAGTEIWQGGQGFATNSFSFSATASGGGGTPRTGQVTGIGGKCVDVAGASTVDGTQVQLFTCNGTGAQQWTVGTDGTLTALGKCLDVAGSGANGTKVQLFACNGSAAQQWQQSGAELVDPQSGRCLDATGVSSADRTPLQVWDCGGGANQQWHLPA